MNEFPEKGKGITIQRFDSNGSPTEKLMNKKGQQSLMHSPENNIISEVNEEDAAYGMPLTEHASLPTMNEMSAGVNRKLANIFNQSSHDFGASSSRPMSTHSGVFGGQSGSHAASPNTSLVRERMDFDSAYNPKEKFDRLNALITSPKQHRRKETFGSSTGLRAVSFMNHDGQAAEDDFLAEDQDFDFIDEEVTRFATEFSEREPVDATVKNALNKKKKLGSDEQEDIVFSIQQQTENFKKVIEFASKSLHL